MTPIEERLGQKVYKRDDDPTKFRFKSDNRPITSKALVAALFDNNNNNNNTYTVNGSGRFSGSVAPYPVSGKPGYGNARQSDGIGYFPIYDITITSSEQE